MSPAQMDFFGGEDPIFNEEEEAKKLENAVGDNF